MNVDRVVKDGAADGIMVCRQLQLRDDRTTGTSTFNYVVSNAKPSQQNYAQPAAHTIPKYHIIWWWCTAVVSSLALFNVVNRHRACYYFNG